MQCLEKLTGRIRNTVMTNGVGMSSMEFFEKSWMKYGTQSRTTFRWTT